MIKLASLLETEQDKRKVALKAAIDIATSYARRGYTPEEAIKDAGVSVQQAHGYTLTPKDIEALKHWIPVHANFR